MRDFFEDYGEIIGAIIGVIILVAIIGGGIMFMAQDQLVQSCKDIGMVYEHSQCVYHWTRGGR